MNMQTYCTLPLEESLLPFRQSSAADPSTALASGALRLPCRASADEKMCMSTASSSSEERVAASSLHSSGEAKLSAEKTFSGGKKGFYIADLGATCFAEYHSGRELAPLSRKRGPSCGRTASCSGHASLSRLLPSSFRASSLLSPSPSPFMQNGSLSSSFAFHRQQRAPLAALLLTCVFLSLSGKTTHCLIFRGGSPPSPLRAPLPASLAKTSFAAGQQQPLSHSQLVGIFYPSLAIKSITGAARDKAAARPNDRVAAFSGAVPISSHAFFSKKRDEQLCTAPDAPAGAAAVAASALAAPAAASAVPPAAASAWEVSSSAFVSAPVSSSFLAAASASGVGRVSISSSCVAASSGSAVAAAPAFSSSTATGSQVRSSSSSISSSTSTVSSAAAPEFDVVIVGLGVGGHAAALHASALGLRTAVVTGGDPGGTCVNRGCVPSKALLAVAKKVKSLRNKKLLAEMGIYLQGPGVVEVDPRQVGEHAKHVVEKVRGGLIRSLAAHGVTSFEARGILNGRADRVYLQPAFPPSSSPSSSSSFFSSSLPAYIGARNILLAPGSTPFVPRGVELDPQQQRVMTSDACVTLPWLPSSVCIVGAGYIGLEFMDVFSSLGSEVTLVDSSPRVLPGVDAEIAKAAERLLLQQFKQRPVTLHRGVFASSVKTLPSQQQINSSYNSSQRQSSSGSPAQQQGGSGHSSAQPPLVEVQLIDAKTKEKRNTLYTDACLIATGRVPNTQDLGLESVGVTLKRGGFVPVDPCMRVTRLPAAAAAAAGEGQHTAAKKEEEDAAEVVEGLYCIGDANGQMMLAHAASAQGIAAVETIAGRPRAVNVKHIPAACFTSPEIAFVGDTEEAAMKEGEEKGFEVGKSVSHFRANTKAVAEGEAEGLLKVLYRKDSGKLLGCHMIGMHASDLIQECATAIANDLTVKQLAFTVHTHPTLSEVADAAWKKAVGMNAH